MEELDNILQSRQVRLDEDEPPDEEASISNGNLRRESIQEREKQTESFLRQDVLVPKVVRFSTSYNPTRKSKRIIGIFVVMVLSFWGLYHFSRIVSNLAAPWAEEVKQNADIGSSSEPLSNHPGDD
eukprot:Nitzschia sp. Nitz4//scaffold35_size145790//8549//8926//NITZ4_003003-RA/size145790-processed-gene-0.221-mRNA-1//-1//CDS//3329549043//1080//frame0